MQAIPTYSEFWDILEYLAPTHYLNWVTAMKDTLRSRFGWRSNPTPAELTAAVQVIVQRMMPHQQFVQMVGILFPDSVYTQALQALKEDQKFVNEIDWQLNDRVRYLRNELTQTYSARDFIEAIQKRYTDFKLTAMTSEKARQCAVVFEKDTLKHKNPDGANDYWTWKMDLDMEFGSERYMVEEEVTIGFAALRLLARYYFYTEGGVLKAHLAFESEFNDNSVKPTLQEKEYVWQPNAQSWKEERD